MKSADNKGAWKVIGNKVSTLFLLFAPLINTKEKKKWFNILLNVQINANNRLF